MASAGLETMFNPSTADSTTYIPHISVALGPDGRPERERERERERGGGGELVPQHQGPGMMTLCLRVDT